MLRGGTARRADARGASDEVDKARQMLQNMSPMTFAKEAEASSSVELALSMELLGVACASPGAACALQIGGAGEGGVRV